MSKYQNFLGLGIAGNFALHLAQAGELEDFQEVITADEAAPKGLFPFYLPCNTAAKNILSTYPLSATTLTLPKQSVNVQAEPEVGLLCKLNYKNGMLESVIPTHFGAYNDASIRVRGAEKISDKKNWGVNSKGFSSMLIPIDTFETNGIMDAYSICSFLQRNGEIKAYGENIELTAYSYFYTELTEWITNQINTQKDFGPLEPIGEYMQECNYPENAIISIGATRYTEYGEKTFLQTGDRLFVAVYNHTEYSLEELTAILQTESYPKDGMSILAQKVTASHE